MKIAGVVWLAGFLATWAWLSVRFDANNPNDTVGFATLIGFVAALFWPVAAPGFAMLTFVEWRRAVRARAANDRIVNSFEEYTRTYGKYAERFLPEK